MAKLKAEAEARQKAEEDQRLQSVIAARRAEEEATAQRKADAEIAALRQATEDANRRAKMEAEAKRAAEAEARRKLEAEAAASFAAEQEAKRKAEAEAETKRRADEALAKAQADREKAEAEAQAKADADAKARAELEKRAETEAKKRAEGAEAALNLPTAERQRLQVGLTSLGFDTRGTDGTFGPRSRDMIAAWQKARGQPATGFLSDAQRQSLLREAAAAVGKYDDAQKKIEEDKKKAEEDAREKANAETKARTAAAAPPSPGPAPPARPADDNKVLEQKGVTVYKTSGLAGTCGSNFNYNIRIYRSMIQLQLGGVWRTARADAQGNFDSSEFTNAGTNNRFRITGNLTQRTLNIENLTLFCAWRATF